MEVSSGERERERERLTSYMLLIDKPYEKHVLVSGSVGSNSISFEYSCYLIFFLLAHLSIKPSYGSQKQSKKEIILAFKFALTVFIFFPPFCDLKWRV